MIAGRADKEKKGRNARQLWLACQSLQIAIANGNPDTVTWEAKIKPLSKEFAAIREAGNSHPFVNTVIDAVPEEAISRGVWSEAVLVDRFSKVHTIGRRVALIDEAGGSLFRYFLSYAQSLLVFASRPIEANEEVFPESLNAFKLLDNSKYCLEKGELEQALRYMNQLKGESRIAAADWIKEMRLLLETRQAADALLAHASAEGLGSLI